jgi:hypothetical protein
MRHRSLAPPLPEPCLRHLGAGDRWETVEPVEIPVGGGALLLIPAGYVFDLASVPRALHWIMDEDNLSTLAPLAHDFLYRTVPPDPGTVWPDGWCCTRREADAILLALAIRQGCPSWRAWAGWAAVRVAGGGAWRG